MADYLHITTNITITAPIETWEDIEPHITDRVLATEIMCRIEETKTEMRKRKQTPSNPHPTLYSWDYAVPATIDNLSRSQADIITAAWEGR